MKPLGIMARPPAPRSPYMVSNSWDAGLVPARRTPTVLEAESWLSPLDKLETRLGMKKIIVYDQC